MAGYTSGIDLSLPGDYSNTYDPYQGYSYTSPYNIYPSYTQQGLLSGGSSNPNYMGYAGVAGAGVGSYDNASTDTGSSVLGGAASGAAAGAAFGPWGMVVGGVIGAIGGLFGSKSKKKQAKKQFEQQKELAVAQIQEQEKNYQLHQQQLKDAYTPYAQYANQGYQFKNGLLGGGNPQQMPTAPQGNPQPPAGQGQAPTNDPNALAQFYQQQAQQQQASAMAQYGGLLHG